MEASASPNTKEKDHEKQFHHSQRNAIVENHLWCIKAVMKQNRALIRAAKLDADDVYQELALRLIRAVMSYDPEKAIWSSISSRSSAWSCRKQRTAM